MLTSVGTGGIADETQLEPGDRVGNWRIEAMVGRGGMATVYRAMRDDGLFEQRVALKILPPGDADRVERFNAERQRLASLEHPGICRIIDGGSFGEQQPWMAMEFIDGEAIDVFADDHDLGLRARIKLMIELCSAVSHAHDNLIAHRDIKPDNVLVDADGSVRLIDFGIASLIDADNAPGSLTAAYAAPEQLSRSEQGASADIFALGMLLHRLLTGALPDRLDDNGVQVASEQFHRKDLAAIALRALATEPEQRYRSVDALAADLTAFLEHRPVAARNGGNLYRAGRFVRRFPLQSALAAGLFIALATGLVTSLLLLQRAEEQRRIAQEELVRAEYFLESSSTALEISNTYQDLMQRVFGSEEELRRLNDSLLTRWQEAHEQRFEEPHKASLISYSIGRHFLFRNDFTNARAVLEPWVTEGYGEPYLLKLGQVLLPIVYINTGDTDLALPMLRASEADYANSFDALSADHIAITSRLAGASGERADIDRTLEVLRAAMDEPQHPELLTYYWNVRSSMQRLLGNLDAAHDAAKEVLTIIEASPLNTLAGRDVARLNLAEYEFYLRGDTGRTRELASAVLAGETSATRVNREYGRATALLALADHAEGTTHRGKPVSERLLEASRIIERFSGRDSNHYIDIYSSYLETLAAEDQRALSAQLLDAFRSSIEERGGDFAEQRLLQAKAIITGDADQPWNEAVIRTHVGLSARQRQIERSQRRPNSAG